MRDVALYRDVINALDEPQIHSILIAAVLPFALLHDTIKAVRKKCVLRERRRQLLKYIYIDYIQEYIASYIWRVDLDPTCWFVWTIVLKAK